MSGVGVAAKPRAYVRRAMDCLVAPSAQSEGTHRAEMASLIDYQLAELTNGAAGALASAPGSAASLTEFNVGWHRHDCQMQIVIVLDGAVDSARGVDHFIRVSKGDVSLIPGGVAHGGTEPSANYQAFEITFPGVYQTTVCPAPSEAESSNAETWSRSAARRVGAPDRGLVSYAYPVRAPHNARYSIEFQRRTRAAAFEPGALRHKDAFRFLLVLEGSREVEIEGETFRLGRSDMLVLPDGAECRDLSATSDHEGIWVRLLR